MIYKKIGQFFLILAFSTAWIFSGWPQILDFPQEIKKAEAQAPLPAYRASGTFAAGTGVISPAYPASMAANDICLLAAESENQAISLTSAQGFVGVPTWSPQSAGTAATDPASRLAVFWKRTVGGDTAPTFVDSGDHTTAVIHCFSGVVTSGNPWDTGAGGNDNGSNDTTGNIQGATTTVDNTLVVLMESTSFNGTNTNQCSAFTNASLANITERQDNSNTAGLGGGSCMATGEKASIGAYSTTTVTMANTTFKGAISLALKPQLPTYELSAYRLFNSTDSTDVGSALAAQDTAATLSGTGALFRLRLLFHIAANQLIASGQNFKLQFAQQSGTCDTSFSGETYADVTGSTVIAYKNNATPADGDNLTANANDPIHSADTIVNQGYEEANNFTNSVAAIPSGQDGKWDFSLFDNGASASTAYCFRAVKSDGSILDTYSVIPQIMTALPQSLTFSISSNTIRFGTLSASSPRYASSTAAGDSSDTSDAHTISVSTNASSGYVVTLNGATLASGANTITAIGGTAAASSAGTEQFGERLIVNSGTGSATSPYASANWAFDTVNFPDQVASGNGDGATTVYGVRYIGNVGADTEPGNYSATFTYTATATF